MKFEINWRKRTLEDLENNIWSNPMEGSYLVTRCYQLRKVSLESFTTEDLRIMIGQQIGLDYLIPLAIEVLETDLFIEGDFFKGDLLKNVLDIETEFWNSNEDYFISIEKLISERRNEISAEKFETIKFDNCIRSCYR